MRHRAKKRLSLIVLVLGLPAYIFVAISLVNFFDRSSFLIELFIYIFLGFLWILPFRAVFLGVGRPDPDA